VNWKQPDIPTRYHKLYEQGRAGKTKAAIRCHCLMCTGWDAGAVASCTATGCPLFNLRNKAAQAKTDEVDRAKRRARAKASGARPPQRAADHGHGAQEGASVLNAAESAAIPLQP